jgi:hypothetical protein
MDTVTLTEQERYRISVALKTHLEQLVDVEIEYQRTHSHDGQWSPEYSRDIRRSWEQLLEKFGE